MYELRWSLVLVCGAVMVALGVLQVASVGIGAEAATRAANMVLVVGGLGLAVGGCRAAWLAWQHRRR